MREHGGRYLSARAEAGMICPWCSKSLHRMGPIKSPFWSHTPTDTHAMPSEKIWRNFSDQAGYRGQGA